MALKARVFGAGKLLLLIAALAATYLLFAAASARIALKLREVRVPELRGRTLTVATTALAEAGLALRVDDSRRMDPKVPAGQISAQEPRPGVTARRGRGVRVWLSAGPRVSQIPQLTGETERTAELRLQQDGLELAGVAEIRSHDYPDETVVGQEPPPTTAGEKVSLLVNRGERGASYLMPDVIGINGDRAADFLRARGFRVAVVARQPYPGLPPGVVLRQSPQAGFQIAPGEAISLEVSR
jgi:serine/threonine-protein kinase